MKEDIPIDENETRITSKGLVRDYTSFAATLLFQVCCLSYFYEKTTPLSFRSEIFQSVETMGKHLSLCWMACAREFSECDVFQNYQSVKMDGVRVEDVLKKYT
nr:ribonuclease P protein subunit p25-like protein [Tanacetum cinerariifolium]